MSSMASATLDAAKRAVHTPDSHYRMPEKVNLKPEDPYKAQVEEYENLNEVEARALEEAEKEQADSEVDLKMEKEKADADARANTQRILSKYAKKGVALAATQAISTQVPGISSIVDARAAILTHYHIKRLLTLNNDPCTTAEDNGVCKGLLTYVLHQKHRKRRTAGAKAIPAVGLLVTAYGKGKNLYKRYKGTAGKERGEQAALLVSHAREGCTIAGAVFVEIVVGDYRKQGELDEGTHNLGHGRSFGIRQG